MSDETLKDAPPKDVNSRLTFTRYAVIRSRFDEVPHGDVDAKAPNVDVNMGLQFGVAMGEEGKSAEVHVVVVMDPDPRHKPYHIEITVAGLFSVVGDAPPGSLKTFAQTRAPIILWPFIRDEVYRMTVNGRFGHVLMNLVAIESLLQNARWEEQQAISEAGDLSKRSEEQATVTAPPAPPVRRRTTRGK